MEPEKFSERVSLLPGLIAGPLAATLAELLTQTSSRVSLKWLPSSLRRIVRNVPQCLTHALVPFRSRVNEAILSLTIHRGGERDSTLAAGERCVASPISRLFCAIEPRATIPSGKREVRVFQEALRLRNNRVSKFVERECCSAGASVHGEPFLLAASSVARRTFPRGFPLFLIAQFVRASFAAWFVHLEC